MPYLVTKKVVRTCEPLTFGPDGKTFGFQVDAAIAQAVANHEEIAEISFGFEGDEFGMFARAQHEEEGAPYHPGNWRHVLDAAPARKAR